MINKEKLIKYLYDIVDQIPSADEIENDDDVAYYNGMYDIVMLIIPKVKHGNFDE